MFRWGVLSTAKIGRQLMIPAIMEASDNVLTAIASRDISKARALANDSGAPFAFGSYDELLASDAVDAVYVPLPTAQHLEWAAKAAEAGKHVLVEKPLALRAEDIQPLIAVRDRQRVLISEGYMVTYHPQWAKVRALIAEGAIGTLKHVQASFSYYNVDPGNMRNIPELGGGVLADIGGYPTVTTRFATGKEPLRVQAKVERDPNFGTDVYSSIRADFGEFEMSFYVSTQLASRQLIVFHGDKGFIEVRSPWNAGLYEHHKIELHNEKHTEAAVFRFPGVNQYKLQVEAFSRAAQGGEASVFALEDSVKNQKVIDAAFRAGEAGGWVEV